MEVLINNKTQIVINTQLTGAELKQLIEIELDLVSEQYYLLANGKCVQDYSVIQDGRVCIIPRVLGGKGGFGSMLRAIGAQIEKTTNREACRDLSGRRLRDINEEQRLKNWINQQAEREKEAKERKQKKLERLCERPKHEFKDDEYDKERSALPENVEDAVLQGLQASCSTKRKAVEKPVVKKKKPKLWVDDELDEELTTSSSDEDEECDTTETKQPTKVSVGIQKDLEPDAHKTKRGILKYSPDSTAKKSDKISEPVSSKQHKDVKRSEEKAPEEKKKNELAKYEKKRVEPVKNEMKKAEQGKQERKRVD